MKSMKFLSLSAAAALCVMGTGASAASQVVAHPTSGEPHMARSVPFIDQGNVKAFYDMTDLHEGSSASAGYKFVLGASDVRSLTTDELTTISDALQEDSSRGSTLREVGHSIKNDPNVQEWALIHADFIPSFGDSETDAQGNFIGQPRTVYVKTVADPKTFGPTMSTNVDFTACKVVTMVDAYTGEELDSYGRCPLIRPIEPVGPKW